MDRALRRERKARIRARLFREWQQWTRGWNWQVPQATDKAELEWRRWVRNEGKSNRWASKRDNDYPGDAPYQAQREMERMAQEQQAWRAGHDPEEPLSIGEADDRAGTRLTRPASLDRQRRDTRFCPVCLRRLPHNLRRTRRVRQCPSCGAQPKANGCPRCHQIGLWSNRRASACRACGLYQSTRT